MKYIIIAVLCMIVWSGVHAEWPRWNVQTFTGMVVYISPDVRGQGCVGLDLAEWRKWKGGLGATPTGWGGFLSRQIWIFPADGFLHGGLEWGKTSPIWFGAGVKARW